MTLPNHSNAAFPASRLGRLSRTATAAALVAAGLAGCGGSGNPLDNASQIANTPAGSGQTLSYAYFQRCVEPVFLAQLPIQLNGVTSVNTCAGSGCHANATGAGGAFRVVPTAQVLDVSDPANTPAVIRASDMYKNFYSAQGEVIVGSTTQTRLLAKPLLLNVLHGGGRIFTSIDDPNAKLIAYWVTHPVPLGQDEFSSANDNMFTPANPMTGACNSQ